jgi:signal transduction histidine kinase/ligand-binding sensor domain-containing protein
VKSLYGRAARRLLRYICKVRRRLTLQLRLLPLILACCAAPASQAQRYPFFNIGIEQGLVQSQPATLLQDRFGQLWVGTLGGLACYDGERFRSFNMRDGLPSNTIKALSTDQHGDLCVGTMQGLSVYDGHSFRNFRFATSENPRGNAVSKLSLARDGNLWCLAGQRLFSWRDGKTALLRPPREGMRWSAVQALDGDLWAAAAGAAYLYRYRLGAWDSLLMPEGLPNYVFNMAVTRANQLALVSGRGVFLRNAQGWQPVYERQSPDDLMPYSFAEAADGSFWIGANHGALRISGGKTQHFDKQNGFTDVTVEAVLRDRENNMWFASNGEGLYRFSGAAFTAVDERMGLDGPQVSAIAQAPDSVTYFGSFDGGLYRYENGRAVRLKFPGSGGMSGVACLALRGHTLWIGTHNAGLWQRDLRSGAMRRIRDKRLMPTIGQMVQDSSGMWLADGRKVFRLQGDSLHALPLDFSVDCFALVGRDSLLLSSSDGLKLFSNGTATSFRTNSGVDSGQVVCMAAHRSTIWIGTADNGLFGIDRGASRVAHVGRAEGLRSDFIYNLYPAPDGSVWAGTGFGICHVLSPFDSARVVFYGRNEGLVGMESNRNAVLPLPDGRIWFGTTGGAQLFHPESVLAQTRPVSLQLESVALFGEPLLDTSLFKGVSPFFHTPLGLRLPYRKNSLSFSFTAISLSGDADISYRYRLEGLSTPWSDWSVSNKVTFSALPPGSYELQVQCSTDGIHPLTASLSYPFVIITPFHKTTLFRLLIVLACIVLGIGLQYLAARGKRKRLAQLEAVRREEQAKVRQRTAEDFHDEVGNKLTRINVLTNVLRSKTGNTADADRIISQIQDSTGQLYSGTRDILWSLQPSNDNLYQVLNRIRDFGRDLFGDTDTEFKMDEVPAAWKDVPLAMDASRNLIMIFKEALNNALKYSGATLISVHCSLRGTMLEAVLQDNGDGFDCALPSRGQGLTNMRTRATRLGGSLELHSGERCGTLIRLSVKVMRQ